MAKIVLFFCAIILASAAALPTQSADGGVVDIIKKVVHKLEDIMEKVFTEGPNFIDTFPDKYDDRLTKVLDVTRTVLTKIAQALKVVIDKVAEQSNDAGKKLVSCVEQHEADLVNIRVALVEGAGKCVKDSVVALVNTGAPLLKDLTEIHKQARDAAEEIDNCEGDNAAGLLCVFQVAMDILKVDLQIPDAVKGDIQPVIDAGKALHTAGKKCIHDQVPAFYANTGKLLGEIATCAAA
ncbi:uncharacterized protein LOC126887306 [Diabrotica virgifera virgifera]|uniref:Uncharacterized protein LOC114341026 n=1 Tax=Diabrotica virgifera virgifera TaxID=50390 RepID=A0A6P7GDR9_DIAVI|nr:uncharacterized protein LOC126887306 [Diabrotica virgifera virgifera]